MVQRCGLMSFAALLAFQLAGCGAEDDRWNSVRGLSGDAVQPDFMVSSTAVPQAGDLTFDDLPDPVAAAYVEAAAKVASTPLQLAAILRTPIRSAGVSSDATGFQRALVMNVFEKGFAPADSLVRTRLTIIPREFIFTNLEAAKTDYSTIAIDKISTTDSVSGTASVSAGLPVPGGSGSASVTGSHSVEKSADVSARVEDLTVNLENGSLVVFREGARGRDLTGNTIVKLTIQDATPASEGEDRVRTIVTGLDVGGPHRWKTGVAASADFERRHGLHPKGMIADVRLDYVLRHVIDGAETYQEGDDAVRFETGCVAKDVVLVPASESALQTWVIFDGSSPVQIDADTASEDLTFEDYKTAVRFTAWLKATGATSIGGVRLLTHVAGNTIDPAVPIGRDRSALKVISTTGHVPPAAVANGRPHVCGTVT